MDFPLASSLSLYPRASIGAAHISESSSSGVRETEYVRNRVFVGLYLPLLVHVASHAFVGFGPSVTHDLMNRYKTADHTNNGTTIAASLTVGGWLSR